MKTVLHHGTRAWGGTAGLSPRGALVARGDALPAGEDRLLVLC